MSGQSEGMATLKAQLRNRAWRLKKVAIRNGGSLLPRWAVRGEITTLLNSGDAWPPVRSVFPEPFVFRPPKALQPLFDSNPLYAGRPIVLGPVALHGFHGGI